jgi:3-oxo-5-alpha-steroid 4-dehydrogenase 1
MSEQTLFGGLLYVWFALAVLFLVSAPYGRHVRGGWGPTLGDKVGWVIMEAPAAVVYAACFCVGGRPRTATTIVFLAMWEIHYVHRAFIYPLGRRSEDARMPILIAGAAFLFNGMNGYLNGRYLYALSPGYANTWLSDPRFLAGLGLFIAGYLINRQSDQTLRNLRRPGDSGYQIPYGGLYRWISCPNYLGEIVEWIGWAVATWSLPGLGFALWVIANLTPRAWSHHRWYQAHFSDYPERRKALVPGVW